MINYIIIKQKHQISFFLLDCDQLYSIDQFAYGNINKWLILTWYNTILVVMSTPRRYSYLRQKKKSISAPYCIYHTIAHWNDKPLSDCTHNEWNYKRWTPRFKCRIKKRIWAASIKWYKSLHIVKNYSKLRNTKTHWSCR